MNLYGMLGNDSVNFSDYLGLALTEEAEMCKCLEASIRKQAPGGKSWLMGTSGDEYTKWSELPRGVPGDGKGGSTVEGGEGFELKLEFKDTPECCLLKGKNPKFEYTLYVIDPDDPTRKKMTGNRNMAVGDNKVEEQGPQRMRKVGNQLGMKRFGNNGTQHELLISINDVICIREVFTTQDHTQLQPGATSGKTPTRKIGQKWGEKQDPPGTSPYDPNIPKVPEP